MKLCKVKITKNRTEERTDFSYPQGYNANIIKPFIYENQGNNVEYCLAQVPDDFSFTNDIVEINQIDAEALVDSWVDSDKDIIQAVSNGKITTEELNQIKDRKKTWCNTTV